MRTPTRCLPIAITAMIWAVAPQIQAQVNMSSTNSYSQTFNTLGTAASNVWAENSTLANWYWQSGAGSTALATYVGSTGTGTAGAGYSYGSAALPGDRAMGSICSNASGAIAYGLLLRNTSGVSISNITVAYTGEQWRNNGNTTAQVLSFYYKTFTAVSTTLNPFVNGTWNNLAALNFTSPVATATAAALDGNAIGNRSVLPATAIPITLVNNDYLFIKWDDPNDTGNDHGLSIDDVTVSWVVNTVTPNVGFAPALNTVTEGATQTVNVTMDIAPSSDVTVSVADALTGSATSGSDYTAFTTTALTFPALGTYPLAQTVSIATINDPTYESTETVNLSLSLSSGTANISPNSYQLTINDNDPLPLVLNEVDYDNPGTDDQEFVEIKNTGATPINLAGFKIELVNGAAGGAAVYTTITLPSFSLAGGAYYVVGNNAIIPNINLVVTPATNFAPQNGSPDAIGLRDPSNVLLDAVSYEGNSGAPYTEGTGILIANSDDATAGIGISRFPDGSDTNDNSVDWGRHCLSPGAANNASSINCICTPPAATAISQCIDNSTWEIVVSVTSTGSGSTVNITNDVNGSSQLAVGVGNWTIGPFNNNAVVNVTVAHQTFALCNLTLSGFFQNCQPDCNNVVGGPDVPGAPCDDLDAGTINDVWSPSCVCAGILIQPIVGFISPTSTVPESGVALTVGLEMDIAPTAPVVVDVTDLLTGTATSAVDYGAIGTLQFTFLPSDTYPYLQTFNVIINDDPDYEGTETFNLNLAVSSGTALTSTTTFVGVITSEDLAPLRINEVDYDNAGTDNAEWIELKNTGSTAFDISGFSVQLINGNLGGAAVYKTIVLPSFSVAAGGYYVIGNSNTIPNLNLLQTPATDMVQNGAPDAIGLRDPFNTLIDAISYEGNTGAPYTEGTGLSVAQADDNVLAAKVIARYLDGNDTDNNSVDWKVWCATPGASNATVDPDGDVIPNCLDNCPNLFGVQGDACNDNDACTINDVITNACVCAGTFQDTDGDGLCDANDNCPNLSGVQGDACNDNDACTINDAITNACVCAGTFQDTDGDGLCDANDNCPTLSGVQGDACNDNDACTINDVITNACVCAGTFQDTDLDGVCDASDNCPTVPGQIGSACNDSNPFTTGDVLNASCVCVGTPVPCDNWTLTIDAGTDGSAISWQIVDATSPFVLDNGGPYTNGSSNAETICVPQGACFNLTFTDDANGIAGGGWKLVDNSGRRILDNVNNGGCFSGTSTNPLPFCNEPASAQTVIATQCDRENWIMSDVIIASVNAAVSAQYGIGDQTDDGYQFWFYNPCGGYSRRIFRNHAISGGQGPANALRATKLALSTMVTNPLPIGQLLNVRVRARVNGVDGAWGPACRFKVDPSACTLTQLNNFNTSPNYSCGVNGKVVGAGGNTGKVFANVVTSGGVYATHYRFEFSVAGEGYLRNVVSTTAVCVLGVWQTNPLLCGTYTYDVRVQASFDGGNTYCPFGPSCTVGITNNQLAPYCTPTGGSMMEQADVRADEFDGGDFAMYPNPNDGTRLFLQMSGISENVTTMSVDIFDAMGKRVSTSVMPVSGSAVNTVIDLDNSLPNGLYFVTITAGNNVRTERLVIQ